MRRRTIARIMVALAVCAAPSTALSQRRRGRNRPAAAEQQAQPAQGAEQPAAGGEGGMTFSADEAQQEPVPEQPAAGAEQPAGGADTGTGIEDIGGADVRAQVRPMRESIWSVQQIYALRNRRFELQPNVGISLNDPYVAHTGLGVAANYWVTNVLAVGLNFMWNQGLNGRSDLDFRVARSAGVVVPINEYQMLGALNFSYVPLYGKFLMFNRFIFHWDMYLVAGVGLIRTRPIPVVDPEVRTFEYNTNLMFNAGVGVRVFLNRWLGVIGEVRNYIYSEPLESTRSVFDTEADRRTPENWRGQPALTDNVMIQVGLTVFLPFSVNYRLQK